MHQECLLQSRYYCGLRALRHGKWRNALRLTAETMLRAMYSTTCGDATNTTRQFSTFTQLAETASATRVHALFAKRVRFITKS